MSLPANQRTKEIRADVGDDEVGNIWLTLLLTTKAKRILITRIHFGNLNITPASAQRLIVVEQPSGPADEIHSQKVTDSDTEVTIEPGTEIVGSQGQDLRVKFAAASATTTGFGYVTYYEDSIQL